MDECMLRKAEVLERTGVSEGTLRREEAAGRFPRRRMLTRGRCAWLASEIVEWMRSRPAGALVERTRAANAAHGAAHEAA